MHVRSLPVMICYGTDLLFSISPACMGCLGRPSVHVCIQRISRHSADARTGRAKACACTHARTRCTCSVMDPRILEFSDHHALRMHRGCHVHSWHTQFKSRHEIICKAFSKDIAGVYQVVFRPFHPA